MTSYVSSCISSHVALSAAYIIPLQTPPYSVHILLTYCTVRLTTTPYLRNTLIYIISQLINQVSFLTWRSWFLPNQTQSVEQFTIYFPLSFVLAFVGQFRTILSTWRGRVLFRGSWERYRATFTAAIMNISFVGFYVWRRNSYVCFFIVKRWNVAQKLSTSQAWQLLQERSSHTAHLLDSI